MIIKTVTYGRTIEVGRFGRGRSGRVWFGWEVEREEGESEEMILDRLRLMADAKEIEERETFERRERFDR